MADKGNIPQIFLRPLTLSTDSTDYNITSDFTADDAAFTADGSTDICTAAAHGFASGDLVHLTNAGGALPTGLAVLTDYYLIVLSANTFALSNTKANALAGIAIDFTGNGTGTHTVHHWKKYILGPAPGDNIRLVRTTIHYQDTTGFTAQEFGNLGAVLDPGLRFVLMRDGQVYNEFTSADPITTNGDWGHICYDVQLLSWGAGDEFIVVRWTFEKAGFPVRLNGDSNEEFVLLVNDDLQGLIDFSIIMHGYFENYNDQDTTLGVSLG
jgi:hypothetical protein